MFLLRTWIWLIWLCNTYALLCPGAIVVLCYRLSTESCSAGNAGCSSGFDPCLQRSEQCCLRKEGASCSSHWVKKLPLPFVPCDYLRYQIYGLDDFPAIWLACRITCEGTKPLCSPTCLVLLFIVVVMVWCGDYLKVCWEQNICKQRTQFSSFKDLSNEGDLF